MSLYGTQVCAFMPKKVIGTEKSTVSLSPSLSLPLSLSLPPSLTHMHSLSLFTSTSSPSPWMALAQLALVRGPFRSFLGTTIVDQTVSTPRRFEESYTNRSWLRGSWEPANLSQSDSVDDMHQSGRVLAVKKGCEGGRGPNSWQYNVIWLWI